MTTSCTFLICRDNDSTNAIKLHTPAAPQATVIIGMFSVKLRDAHNLFLVSFDKTVNANGLMGIPETDILDTISGLPDNQSFLDTFHPTNV